MGRTGWQCWWRQHAITCQKGRRRSTARHAPASRFLLQAQPADCTAKIAAPPAAACGAPQSWHSTWVRGAEGMASRTCSASGHGMRCCSRPAGCGERPVRRHGKQAASCHPKVLPTREWGRRQHLSPVHALHQLRGTPPAGSLPPLPHSSCQSCITRAQGQQQMASKMARR